MHTVQSIYSSIVSSYPQLFPEERDDILATLEELEKRYGVDFFDQKTTLQNVLRLTGMKYHAIKCAYQGILEENADIKKSTVQIETSLNAVSEKIDHLLKIQKGFPDYPVTHLSSEEESAIAVEICGSASGNTVIETGGNVGDLILNDLCTLYYLMPTKKDPEMTNKKKYSALIGEFKPGFTEEDYDLITTNARDIAKLLNLRMTDPLNFDNYLVFAIHTVDKTIEVLEATIGTEEGDDDSMARNSLEMFKAIRKMMTENKGQILRRKRPH